MVTARGMAFGPFLGVNRRLDQMSESELKEATRALASDLQPVESEPILAGRRRPAQRLWRLGQAKARWRIPR